MKLLSHEHRQQESPLLQEFTRSISEHIDGLLQIRPLFLARMTVGSDEEVRIVGKQWVLADRLTALMEQTLPSGSSGGHDDNEPSMQFHPFYATVKKALGKLHIIWNHRKRMRDERSKPP